MDFDVDVDLTCALFWANGPNTWTTLKKPVPTSQTKPPFGIYITKNIFYVQEI